MTRFFLLVLTAPDNNCIPAGKPVLGAVTVTFPLNPPKSVITTRGKTLRLVIVVIVGALMLRDQSLPVTLTVKVALWVIDPAVPVIKIWNTPVVVDAEVAILSEELPPAATADGEKVAVIPEVVGSAVAESVTSPAGALLPAAVWTPTVSVVDDPSGSVADNVLGSKTKSPASVPASYWASANSNAPEPVDVAPATAILPSCGITTLNAPTPCCKGVITVPPEPKLESKPPFEL